MPMAEWLQKYPRVQALLERPDDVLDGVSLEGASADPSTVLPEVPVVTVRLAAFVTHDRCYTLRGAPVCTCGAYRLRWE